MTTNSGPPNAPSLSARPRSRAAVIMRDAHFWIPLAVLLGGLAVLEWIS